ncbi:MAG: tetratricopeptide repeat protein [Candidatus Brocadiales bacterium]|nr:tetratricopeptide repeat protein [Candidatus Brocadiales bacterium]
MAHKNNMLNQSFLLTKTARILLPLLVSLISFLAYLNVFHHQFVFDDFRVITNNPYIKDWKYFSALFNRDYFKISGELSYRPLVTLSYFIDYSIWGLNPFGFHLTNLLIHTLNTFIAYLLIFKITKNLNLTVISCLFFGIHPILTETVNSVGFREDLLCATFFLLALFFYVKHYTSKYKKICYVASLLAYFFSLLSKEMAISLPLIIFFLDLFFPQAETYLKKKIIRYYLGFICMSIAYILLRLVFFKSTIEHVAYPGNSLATNFLTMTKVIASYVKLWFFPVILNPDYHVTFEITFTKLPFLLSVALLICIVVITLRLYKKEREITFSILWAFITLIPVMNIIPLGNIMAERYLYIPSLGFCMFLGMLILKIPTLIQVSRTIIPVCLIVVLSPYFIHTIKHNRIWSNEQTLWTRTVYNTSCSFNAHNNLGKEYFQKGLVDKAIEEYTIALSKASEVQYKYPTAHYNLGVAYDEKGMYEASIREYKNALRIDPKNGDAHNNLAITFFKNGQVDMAIEEFRAAITQDPNNPTYHDNLAKLYYRINMPGEAKTEQELANRLKH